MSNNRGVILLNKTFIGTWLNDPDRIGHEVIDFFKSDTSKYYIYNNPHGTCNDNITCEDNDDKNEKNKKIAKYLVLTSNAKCKTDKKNNTQCTFRILYVIKLKKRIKNGKKDIPEEDLKYGKVALNKIFDDENNVLVTFEGEKIYRANNSITINYNFQRNRGYVYEENNKTTYDSLLKEIEKITIEENEISLNPVEESDIEKKSKDDNSLNKNFLNLIKKGTDEQSFTFLLCNLLKSNDSIFNDFIKYCVDPKNIFPNLVFDFKSDDIESEKVIKDSSKKQDDEETHGGRIDIFAENKDNVVIIENKINSGLNGIYKVDGKRKSQLSTYYNKYKDKNTLCFIMCPDFKKNEVIKEIKEEDPEMENVYDFILYSKIKEFIKKENWDNYFYKELIDGIINAFESLSYENREEVYKTKFLNSIAKNR